MSVAVGAPLWTNGHFSRVAAQDDLGIEALGAALLRELIPGVVQTSISAGYYAYYPFLLDEFERQNPDETRRSEFQQFYRRQEAAFAVACSMHTHRGNLRGINGINAATQAADESYASGTVDLARLAEPGRYMKTPLGGYGLFYRPALEDIGLTRLGSGNKFIDRATELGRAAAEGFRAEIEETDYWSEWAEADSVPVQVLQDLAETVCPCGVPGRRDHEPVLDALFSFRGETERWHTLRRYRVQSFGMLLEFHAQRPDHVSGLGEWRRALLSGRIGGDKWQTKFPKHRDAWRAYQHRETLVAALTTVFTNLLFTLEELGIAGLRNIQEELVARFEWKSLPCERNDHFATLLERTAQHQARPEELIDLAEEAMETAAPATIGRSLAVAIRLLASLSSQPTGDDEFHELLARGGHQRLSPTHMAAWFQERSSSSVESVVAELAGALFHRHLQVATAKLSVTDHRDPFCVAEEEDAGYRVIRDDEPFWTGARFATLNHLLWTVGALDDPDGDGRPTELGHSLLAEVAADG